MTRECMITGRRRQIGNKVSHANNKSKTKNFLNLHKKKIFDPETGESITIRVSSRGIKTLDKAGGLSKFIKKEAKKLFS